CPVDPERAADIDGLDTRYERVPLLTTGSQNQMGIDQFRPLAVTRCDLADSRLRQREQRSAVGTVEKVQVVGTEWHLEAPVALFRSDRGDTQPPGPGVRRTVGG